MKESTFRKYGVFSIRTALRRKSARRDETGKGAPQSWKKIGRNDDFVRRRKTRWTKYTVKTNTQSTLAPEGNGKETAPFSERVFPYHAGGGETKGTYPG